MKKCYLAMQITHWVIPDLARTLNCEFSYNSEDPFAVTMVFNTDAEWPVDWIFARELLADGLNARVGEGDVVIWPMYDHDGGPTSFCVQVGGARTALFEIDAEPVVNWLAKTYEMVPCGAELNGVDWDQLVQLAE
ncbi:SsgA family sporulation/cell division regulator [Streptomyces sp. NPDC056749]|uniref:SsgA family sporulation/cell division regulator n=1 Tax=Streptomyces sp. NPDC056749 TaxID=3345936 RepID=UPI0036988438